GYDGIALFGVYRSVDSAFEGYSAALDAWGGHKHNLLGYHYHANRSTSWTVSAQGGATGTPYRIRSLIVGAYKGKLVDVSYFVSKKGGGDMTFLGGL
ncbi:hypothetical protein, partial [Methyloprofundus sp.]|uniref:hypothetical protein n=1 Tax=Methyloprofundus sp. TaxID=2020875 RepID=UPI0026072E8E